MSEQIGGFLANVSSLTTRIGKLAKKFANEKFRNGYVAESVTGFLAMQIRALRGDDSQTEFGRKIGKPQSVVSRLENQGTVANLQTLIDIAQKLKIGIIIRFVDFPTFLKWTDDVSQQAIAPAAYSQEAVDRLATQEEQRVRENAFASFFRMPEPLAGNAEKKLGDTGDVLLLKTKEALPQEARGPSAEDAAAKGAAEAAAHQPGLAA